MSLTQEVQLEEKNSAVVCQSVSPSVNLFALFPDRITAFIISSSNISPTERPNKKQDSTNKSLLYHKRLLLIEAGRSAEFILYTLYASVFNSRLDIVALKLLPVCG